MNNLEINWHQEKLYHHMPCGCMTVNSDGVVVDANDTFLDYSGYKRDEMINQLKIDDLISAQSLLQINENIKPVLNLYGFKKNNQISLMTKEGVSLSCSSNSLVINDDTAQPLYYHHTFIDIRE